MNLLICISGCGGGKYGPNHLYGFLPSYLSGKNFEIFLYDTIPNSVEKNVNALIDLFIQNTKKYENIFLIAWSMGSAVAINLAYFINSVNRRFIDLEIKAIILLAPQEAEMENIEHLNIPILFIHGTSDKVLPYDISESLYNNYKGIKDIILFDGIGHDLTCNVSMFANIVSSFFDSLSCMNIDF